ncbi:MAG TPA: hypothetical protein VM008_01330 [Phycisphaerae bacterium]|nr:hypothetical protein [Phycisphaerae bacterium]
MKTGSILPAILLTIGLSGVTATVTPALAQTVATHPASSNALLTSDEVHAIFDAGQYSDALKAVSRILLLTGPAAAPYNRHDMLMIKAECQIQLRQIAGAIGATEAARREAEQAHKTDDEMEAHALEVLLQKSPNGAYTPVTAAVKIPIKLADRTKRKDAYAALYADLKQGFGRSVETAEKGSSLPPYLNAMKLEPTLRVVENAATGATAETDGTVKDLADHASKLVDATLTDMDTKVDRISEEANRIITEQATYSSGANRGMQVQSTHKKGLTGNDSTELNDIMKTCGKIPEAMNVFIRTFPDQADEFKKLASKSKDVSTKADKTLNADYTTM